MAVPQDKQELLDAIRVTYEKLAADLASVPSDRAHEATLEGHARGTTMSVADLVAYLVGWNLLVLKWCEAKAAGRDVYKRQGFPFGVKRQEGGITSCQSER